MALFFSVDLKFRDFYRYQQLMEYVLSELKMYAMCEIYPYVLNIGCWYLC